MRTIDRIILHHSASPLTWTHRDIAAEHARRFGRAGPEYHWIVEADGAIHAGRPEAAVGWHDAGENAHSIGVCLVGQFAEVEPGYTGPPPAPQWTAALELVRSLLHRYGLQVEQVYGHGEVEPPETPTACPGFDCARFRVDLGGTPVKPRGPRVPKKVMP